MLGNGPRTAARATFSAPRQSTCVRARARARACASARAHVRGRAPERARPRVFMRTPAARVSARARRAQS